MLTLFGILIIIASIILGLIVLVQNPKGGGLTGALGGFSNQLMGVKQSTDVMEKGTWVFSGLVGLLCVLSPAFVPKDATSSSANDELLKGVNTKPAQQRSATPQNSVPLPGTSTPPPATTPVP
ncbi:MAG: preprotein translocase subunit SecG [Ferruginibacter sp.]